MELPPGIERPSLGPVATGLGEVFHYLVTSETRSLEELRTLHDWVIAPQLRSVPGVAEVNAWGGKEKQWHVVVDPRRLQQFDLSLGDVYRALEAQQRQRGRRRGRARRQRHPRARRRRARRRPRDRGGGRRREARDADPRARRRAGARWATRSGAARRPPTAKGEVVLGLGFMLMGENSHEVTARARQAARGGEAAAPRRRRGRARLRADRARRPRPAHREDQPPRGRAPRRRVLFVFLGNLRAGLIVAAAIPLSMLFAFDAMLRFGIAGTPDEPRRDRLRPRRRQLGDPGRERGAPPRGGEGRSLGASRSSATRPSRCASPRCSASSSS